MPPFADWTRFPIGTGNITIHRLDGTFTSFEGINYDANRMENGFLVMENDDGRVFHVANVDWWEVTYV